MFLINFQKYSRASLADEPATNASSTKTTNLSHILIITQNHVNSVCTEPHLWFDPRFAYVNLNVFFQPASVLRIA